jgi:hypothetical protein
MSNSTGKKLSGGSSQANFSNLPYLRARPKTRYSDFASLTLAYLLMPRVAPVTITGFIRKMFDLSDRKMLSVANDGPV